MKMVQQHPDGWVYVRTDTQTYVDTTANFEADFQVILPALPPTANERIYDQGVRHAIAGAGGLITGGEMPWPLGDSILGALASGLQAQQQRS